MSHNSIDSSADEARIDSAIADYLDAVQSDAAFDERKFLEQHADISEPLKEFLANRRQLAELAEALGPQSNSVLGSDLPLPSPGTTLKYFGDYLLLEEIARGGMGVIYKARQTKLNRIVAVKLILAGQLASQDTVDRFYIEAQSAAKLSHPNIVAIHEVGQHLDQHFFSMDYVDGASLSELVRDQPLPVVKSVEYVKTVADAIHYAHSAGVLHRDLKPSNILIDSQDQPRITDFGLAKRITDDPGLTATGQVLGTPSYMPPEQALGNHALIGPASDVYSLGAVLYELLTGRPPFLAATPVETILQARHREVISPSLLNPGVSRDLETICLKCLEKEPKKRYASADDLASDLRRMQNHEPIQARPISISERSFRWCRRNPAITILLSSTTALLVVMLVAFIAVVSQWIRAEYFRAQERNAKNQALQAERVAAKNATDARVARQQAITHAEMAREQAEIADQARRREGRNLYVAHMNLAAQAVDEGNFRRAASLLGNYEHDMQESDPRGFEWYHLWRLVHLSGDMTFQQQGRLYTIDVTPDGKYLVTAGRSNSAQLWDLRSGHLEATFEGHQQSISSLAVSPNGNVLCTASNEGTVRVWDLTTRKFVHAIDVHESGVRQVVYLPDGNTIATAGWDGAIRMFNVETNQALSVFTGHTGLVYALAVSPDGKTLVSSCVDATLRWWDVASGENIRTVVKAKNQRAYSIAFAPDGKTFATGSSDQGGMVELWDFATGELISQLPGHHGDVMSVAFAPDGKSLASGSQDQTMRRWDINTGELLTVHKGHAGSVRSVKFLPDGSALVSAAFDGTAKLWRLNDDQQTRDLVQLENGVLSLAWTPDGQTVAASGWEDKVYLIDASSGRIRKTLKDLQASIFKTVFLDDGEILATAGRNKKVQLWETETGELLHTFEGHETDIRGLAWSPQAKILASADRQGVVRLWDIAKRELVESYQHTDGNDRPFPIKDIAFSPDGETLTVLGRYITLIDLTNGDTTRVGGQGDVGFSIAYSSQGQMLVANREELAWLWSPKRKRTLALRGHANVINGVTFSPDGKQIATASEDHTVKLWDVGTGEQLGTLRGHTSAANCLAFSPDGQTLASGGYDGTLRFWRSASAEILRAQSSPTTIDNRNTLYAVNAPTERVIDEIKRRGGRVVRDQDHPDRPVIQVRLTGSEVDDDTLRLLRQFTELQLLSLFNTKATGEGLKHLANCKNLRQLTLMGTSVNDDGVATLKHFPALTHLSLGMGIQPLQTDAAGHPVSPAEDPITNAALAHLAGLPSLVYLAFDNTQLSDVGLRHLEPLAALRQLSFFRTPDVTEAGLDELRKVLPDCEMASHDAAGPDEPHFAAMLVIHAGQAGVNSPSVRVGIGRLADNSFVRTGKSLCGPAAALSTVTWQFLRHEDGADLYDIQWTLTNEGTTIKSQQREVRFNGEPSVIFDDVHQIHLERRSLIRSQRSSGPAPE